MTGDERLMDAALQLAEQGLAANEFPVGAVVALDGEILGSASWTLRPDGLLDHAEVLALREAGADPRVAGRRREQTLYTTLEPCLLCMGAAMSCLVGRVVYALEAPLDGAADVAQVWAPRLGHPSGPAPYAVPDVAAGVGRRRSLELVRRWIEQNGHIPWAAAYDAPDDEDTR